MGSDDPGQEAKKFQGHSMFHTYLLFKVINVSYIWHKIRAYQYHTAILAKLFWN